MSYNIIESAINNQTDRVITKALDFCIRNKLYSATDFRDAVSHFGKEVSKKPVSSLNAEIIPLSPLSKEKIKTKPQIRDISEYSRLFQQTNEEVTI